MKSFFSTKQKSPAEVRKAAIEAMVESVRDEQARWNLPLLIWEDGEIVERGVTKSITSGSKPN